MSGPTFPDGKQQPFGSPMNPYGNLPPEKKSKTGWIILVLVLVTCFCCLPCTGVTIFFYYIGSQVQKLEQQAQLEMQRAQDELQESLRQLAELPDVGVPNGERTLEAWNQMTAIDTDLANDDAIVGLSYWTEMARRYEGIDPMGVDLELVQLLFGWRGHAAEVSAEVTATAGRLRALPQFAFLPENEVQQMAESWIGGEVPENNLAPPDVTEEIRQRFADLDAKRQVLFDTQNALSDTLSERYGLTFE